MNFSPIKKNREVLISTVPALRYNGEQSFAEWQKIAREKLIELLGMDLFVSCDPAFVVESATDCGDYKEYVFSIESEADYRFNATLRVPAGASGKLPLAICLFGHSEDLAASMNGENDRDLCAQALKRGYCALAIEQRNFDNCFAIKDIPLEEALTRTTWCACYRSSMRAAMLRRTTIGERVWDIMHAIDAVIANFDVVDEKNIAVVANSGNSTAAYYAACLDERIATVMISSGVATWESSVARASLCACNYVPKIANYFDMGDVGGLIAPRKIVLIGSTEDIRFPEYGLRAAFDQLSAAYEAAGAKDNCKLVIKNGPRRFYADEAWGAFN